MAVQILLLAAACAVLLIIKYFNQTDIPKISNLPEIPGIPLFGNLIQFGNSHADYCKKLATRYGPIFQARLGNRRFVYVNSFDTIKDLWIGHHQAMCSKSSFWTFHSVVSESTGPTLATSPWNERTKRVKKAAASALNHKAVQSYLPSVDLEATKIVEDILKASGDDNEIDPNLYFQRSSLNMALRVAFGFRLKGNVNDEKIREVVDVERELSLYRGIAHCWQDYIPLMRLWPGYRSHAAMLRARRDSYLLEFYDELKRRIEAGTDVPSITGSVLKDPEAKLNDDELKTISLTMVAAGLDTLPSNLTMAVAYLSSPHGQEIQAKAHAELIKTYPDGLGWHSCLSTEKCEYMVAFVRETLRFWSTFNLSIVRTNIKPIQHQNASFPTGTPFVMNVYAANHDTSRFENPEAFNPERYLGVSNIGLQHLSYGAGSRMCAGADLANRQLYVILSRLILAFHIQEAKRPEMRPVLHPIACSSITTGMVTQPNPFEVRFVPRNGQQLTQWITESIDNTTAFDL